MFSGLRPKFTKVSKLHGNIREWKFLRGQTMVGWAGDNGVCIIQVKICLPGRNMPPEEKYACLEKVQKFFFLLQNSTWNVKWVCRRKICLPYGRLPVWKFMDFYQIYERPLTPHPHVPCMLYIVLSIDPALNAWSMWPQSIIIIQAWWWQILHSR